LYSNTYIEQCTETLSDVPVTTEPNLKQTPVLDESIVDSRTLKPCSALDKPSTTLNDSSVAKTEAATVEARPDSSGAPAFREVNDFVDNDDEEFDDFGTWETAIMDDPVTNSNTRGT
jgi:hypothetical protein